MRISCLQENLARGLSIVSRAVATRSTLPVLSNILLATDQSRLKLSATNLEIGINCWVGASVEEEGATTVPARVLVDFVNSLPPETLDLELITRTQTLNLKCGHYEANIKGIDAQEFPLILVPDGDETVKIKPEILRQMIDQVAFAAATDESRPVLTGVLADLKEHSLTFAAADGYRLSVSSVELEGEAPKTMSIIIPARALQELRRISSNEEKPIEMLVARNRNQVFFRMTDIDLVSQLIEGAFPDYTQIIPTTYNSRVSVSAPDLLNAMRMALIFARDASNMVRVQIVADEGTESGQLIVTATSSEHGDNVSELGAKVDGKPMAIAFNAKYFVDVVNVIDTEEMVLETRDASSPGVIRPAGTSGFVHVIMPMYMTR